MATYVEHQGTRGTTYRVLFDLPFINGKRRQVQKSGFKTEKAAREWYEDYMYNFRHTGVQIKNKKVSFSSYVELWEKVSENKWSAKTHEGYASILRAHLLPAFAGKDLKKISVLDVEEYIAEKINSGLSPTTVTHHTALLKKIMNDAVRQEIILRNPVQRVELPKVARYFANTYAPEEIVRFLKELEGTQFHAIAYVAFWTGMRRGELLPLRWPDVDFEKRLLRITKSKTVVTKRYEKGKVKGQTKTYASTRVISISEDLCEFLKRHKEEQSVRRQTLHYEDQTGLVFTSYRYGRALCSSEITEKLNDMQERVGMRHIRFHDTRHTHVTISLANGVDIVTESRRVGHTRVSTTLDRYSHLLPGADQRAADAFANAVNKVD